MSISIHFLGTGDAFSSNGRNHTCFYIKSSGMNLLLDCGATSLTAMHRQGIETNDIDVILITHFHGDHYGGLPFFLLDAVIYKRNKPLTIVSPAGGREKISALLELLYAGTEVLSKLNIHFIAYSPDNIIQFEYLKMKAYKVEHSKHMECYGVRLELEDKVISYSGDTRWCDALIPLSNSADLFICECSFYEIDIDAHMNYKDFKQHKHALHAKRIILTHFDNEMIAHLNNLPEECAWDGLVLKLS